MRIPGVHRAPYTLMVAILQRFGTDRAPRTKANEETNET
ncbi:hypothetical protein M622_04530 [Thauera terpenica 58Eu]|uniref:Uncharacterized protein n=1 Tax=Thauera terpenica 58Eu TaxID=1348657 RepID=S9ZMI1_9RHOO|nr:hypothetical protein M622_04530 [Thauera terpenica 58Eu]